MAEALFTADPDGRFVPGPLAVGPWDPGLLHGGAVTALAVTQMEAAAGTGEGWRSVRATADLVRPAPTAPLAVVARSLRQGRRVHLLEADVSAGGTLVAHVSLLRLASRGDVVAEPVGPPPQAPTPDPSGLRPVVPFAPGFFGVGTDVRVEGDEERRGVGAGWAWIRLRAPVVLGTEPSPMVRAVAIADIGNGIGAPIESWPSSVTFVNADLAVNLARDPEGEWLHVRSAATWSPDGTGLGTSVLADRTGVVGDARQHLVLAPAP